MVTSSTLLNYSKISTRHSSLIKWCIFLKHKSSSAYELLRKSGFVQLPSQSTLRDYTHYYTTTSGFSTELEHQLMRDSAMSSLKDYWCHICLDLLGDEMYIKDLVYSKSTGELVGFRDKGDWTSTKADDCIHGEEFVCWVHFSLCYTSSN